MKYLGACIFLLLFLCSCTENKRYNQLLSEADSIMNIDDDSAIAAIKMLDAAKTDLPEFTTRQEMRYHLLYHKAMNKADSLFTSDSIMLKVVDYYEHHGSANDRMLAYYVLGCVYRDLYEAPMALEYYNKATEQADTTVKDCDYATLYRIYSQMGILFAKQCLPYQKLASLNKAVKYAYIAKDTLNAIRNYQNLESFYADQNKLDSAIIINNHAAKLFKQHGFQREANIALGCNFSYFLAKGNLRKAKESFEAYRSTNYKGNTNWDDAYAYVLYEQGLYYLAVGKMNSAYSCLTQSLEQSKSFSNKTTSTKGLAQFYLKTNNPTLAAQYALQSSVYNDSNLMEIRQSQLLQAQAMYDYNRNKKIASEAQLNAKHRMTVIYVMVISGIMLFGAFYSVYRKKIKQRNQRIALAQKMHHDSILQLNIAQKELAKLHELNENTIATLVKEKEETIQMLQSEIKKYEESNIGHSLLELDRQLKQSSIYKKLTYLENHPQEKMTKIDWTNLEETVEKQVYGFGSLKQKLNTKEYHICLLVKLYFSPSTISHFIGTSLSDISNYRLKMLSKICGKVGKAKDFDEYIHSLL